MSTTEPKTTIPMTLLTYMEGQLRLGWLSI